MFSIVGVLLCVGYLDAPDPQSCTSWNDTQGPYNSQAACLVRLNEMQAQWPPLYAKQLGVPATSMFWPSTTCKQPDGEPV